MHKFTYSLKNHRFLFLYIVLSFLGFKSYANDFSSKVILEGFKDAHLGFDISYRKLNFRLTAAITSVNSSYISTDGNILLGVIVKKYPNYDWIAAIGSYLKYSQSTLSDAKTTTATIVRPTLGCTMYRYFNKFVIGGTVKLELWEGQKSFPNENQSGWQANRLFNIIPEFVIGYSFL
jgi:hypothetical protein